MGLWLVKPLRYLVAALRGLSSPRQVALGIALGMLVGLVPKHNLTAVALATVLFSLRVNLPAASGAILLFTWVGHLLDPVADRVGLALLASADLRPYWRWLFEQPLVPYTGLNNTVVVGQLALGLALCYPAYHLTKLAVQFLVRRYGERITQKLQRYRLYQLLFGADLATSWSLGA